MEEKEWKKYNDSLPAPFTSSSSSSSSPPSSPELPPPSSFQWHSKLTFADFLSISQYLTASQQLQYWYLHPQLPETGGRMSDFQCWRLKWRLRFNSQWNELHYTTQQQLQFQQLIQCWQV